MVSICGVCSNNPSKYRCPTCNLLSCSLACSQAHKSSCALQQPGPSNNGPDHDPSETSASTAQPKTQPSPDFHTNGAAVSQSPQDQQSGVLGFDELGKSSELQQLWARYPNLRSQLREIHKMTLEEEWVETSETTRGRGRGRYKSSHASRGRGPRNRGPWSAKKGFNRGLGKVRRWRDSCEDGPGGVDNEGFVRFVSLVLAERDAHGQTADTT